MSKESSLIYYNKNKDRINKRRREIWKKSSRVRNLSRNRRLTLLERHPNYDSDYNLHKRVRVDYMTWKETKPEQYIKRIEYSKIIRRKKYLTNDIYRESEKIRLTIQAHNRRTSGKITKEIRNRLISNAKGKCLICFKKPPYIVLSIDHIIPISKGGTNEYSNLQILCMDCNRKKSNKIL